MPKAPRPILNAADIDVLGLWDGYTSIRPTYAYSQLMQRPEKIVWLFTGNQWGKNANIVKHYMARIRGTHPIEAKNMRPHTKHRVIRLCSEKLPTEAGDAEETKNTIYPVFKKMLPPQMIKKDISQRSSTMTLLDPQGGKDIFLEFVSYEQALQSQAGVQRFSIYVDESCTKEFYLENRVRLLASNGDMIGGMTPAIGDVTWQYEEIFERASAIFRGKRVRNFIKENPGIDGKDWSGRDIPEWQYTDTGSDIAVLMCSTDDNPAYDWLVAEINDREIKQAEAGTHPIFKTAEEYVPITKDSYITKNLGFYDTESEAVRRHGIITGVAERMYEAFEMGTHVISGDKYFPDGLPHGWMHGRAIDYHPSVEWHCAFVAISPQDEWFVYNELKMSPERYITKEICREIVTRSKDYVYRVNVIDPLSVMNQSNTGVPPIDDINREFSELKREGIGTGGYWSPWDTKNLRGREQIRMRLKNSRACGRPFNNKQSVFGRPETLPTIWFLNNCRVATESFKNWKHAHTPQKAKETGEPKESFIQKWSHICMAIECLAKEQGFRPRVERDHAPQGRNTAGQYGGHR